MWYNHGISPPKSASTRVECGTAYVQTQESIAQPSVAATETTPKGKTIEADAAEQLKLKKQGRKRKVAEPSAVEPPFRIYHKNRGRFERIFNQKMKKQVLAQMVKGLQQTRHSHFRVKYLFYNGFVRQYHVDTQNILSFVMIVCATCDGM
ncbi:hypothetical protein Tco_0758732 [Tanacetum coccineum]